MTQVTPESGALPYVSNRLRPPEDRGSLQLLERVVRLKHQASITQQIELHAPVAVEVPAHGGNGRQPPAVLVVKRDLLVVGILVAMDDTTRELEEQLRMVIERAEHPAVIGVLAELAERVAEQCQARHIALVELFFRRHQPDVFVLLVVGLEIVFLFRFREVVGVGSVADGPPRQGGLLGVRLGASGSCRKRCEQRSSCQGHSCQRVRDHLECFLWDDFCTTARTTAAQVIYDGLTDACSEDRVKNHPVPTASRHRANDRIFQWRR
ncbi:hypothetical protein SDC9_117068 [bioreactor metagenome]|uniref:Uncharacterized protein n=1 Tax=bioreactor metagenome TaxID=1076179 RepID=A0A645BX78_9ZZZZ